MKQQGTFSTVRWAVMGLVLAMGCSASVGPGSVADAEVDSGAEVDTGVEVDAGTGGCSEISTAPGDPCTEADRLCRFGASGPPCSPSGAPVIDCQGGQWTYVNLSCEGLSPSGWRDGGASTDASRD